jgi:hypothetical protein
MNHNRFVSRIGLFVFAALIHACLAFAQWNTSTPPPPHQKQAPAVEKSLKIFDTLDFDVFSNQKWDRLGESHAKDIIVTWPDGHETHGIEQHIKDLSAMFVYAPDIKIKVHPIRFGSGDWTAVSGMMTGTFSITVGHWKNGKMDHEWLYWDNQDFMKQIGLAQ